MPGTRRDLLGNTLVCVVKASAELDLSGPADTGRSAEQVDEFLGAEVDPLLARYADLIGGEPEVTV